MPLLVRSVTATTPKGAEEPNDPPDPDAGPTMATMPSGGTSSEPAPVSWVLVEGSPTSFSDDQLPVLSGCDGGAWPVCRTPSCWGRPRPTIRAKGQHTANVLTAGMTMRRDVKTLRTVAKPHPSTLRT